MAGFDVGDIWISFLIILLVAVLSLSAMVALTARRIRIARERSEIWHEEEKKKKDGPISRRVARMRRDLEGAGARLSAMELTTVWAGCATVPILVGIVAGLAAAMCLLLGCIGAAIPFLWLTIARKQNASRFEEDLGQAMPLIASNMRGGMPLRQALVPIAENLNEPIKGEFAQLNKDIDRGMPIADAIEAMAERTDNQDLVLFAASVRAQQATGGNLADIVDQVGRTIQVRVELRRSVKSKTSQGRATALIMVAVPPALGVFLTFSNDMYREFFTSPMGWLTLGVCAFFEVLGYMVTKKMCNIRAD